MAFQSGAINMQVRAVELAILILNYLLIHIMAQKLCREKPPNDMVRVCTQHKNYFPMMTQKREREKENLCKTNFRKRIRKTAANCQQSTMRSWIEFA